MSHTHPHFVVNARTTRAGALRKLEELRAEATSLYPGAEWLRTTGAGHAVDLARQAAEGGAGLVVAVGGDGTINEVVNGLLSANVPPPVLGIVPFGSGSDFVKTVGIPRDPFAAMRLLGSGEDRRIDAASVECAPLDGCGMGVAPVLRYFLNIAGCGASGRVVERFNRRHIPGTLGYVVATATAAMGYRWPLVEIAVDEEPARTVHLNVLFVCNAEYCGGGMHVGKGARVDDGLLQVVEAANVSRVGAVLQWPHLYFGGLERVKGIRLSTARTIRVRSAEEVLVDTDGELCGRLPAVYRSVPGALAVRLPTR